MKLCSHPLLALTLLVQLALAPSLWAGPASHVGRPDAPGVDVDQATSTLRFGPRFQDRMVVQRGVALRVDGRAIPGREVEARFDGEVATTRADGDGLWGVSFAPRGPSLEPLTLVATCEGQRVAVDDVLVGDPEPTTGDGFIRIVSGATGLSVALLAGRYRFDGDRLVLVPRGKEVRKIALHGGAK